MWIFLSRELWRWNQTVTPALRAAILSASLDTQKKKKAYFLFHIIKVSLRYLSPSLWNQPTATATLSRHCTAAAYKRPEAPSRGHVVKPQGWGESLGPGPQLQPPPPTAWQIAICTAEILILLSKHIQGFPASVVWLTAPVSEGLALCTPNVRPQPDDCLSVHGLLSEWWVMWGDGSGWEWAEEGGWGKLLPQESEPHLACGIWLPLRRADAAATTASAFSLRRWQTPIKPTLWEWSMMTLHVRPLPRDLKGLQILGWENAGPYTSSSTPPKTTTLQRWKQVFLAPLTAWSFF